MPKHSQVEIDCELARALAAGTIDRIDQSRSEKVERIITREVERLNNGFWHKLFRRPDFTREEAMQMELDSEWSQIYDTRNFLFGRQYDVAMDVLAAAKVGKTLLLSLDDYRRIS
jgi:hypothetical protein